MEQNNIPKSTSGNISNIESRGSRMIRMVKTIKAITPINAVATFNENVTNLNVQNAASVNICNSGEKIKISTEPMTESTLFELLVEQDLSATDNASIIESPIVGLDNSLDTASKSILCSAGGNILPTYIDKNQPLNKTQESHLSPGSSRINTGVLEHPESPSDYSDFDDSDADPIYEPLGTNEISLDDEGAMPIERMAVDIERRLDDNDKNQTKVENQKTRQIKRNLGKAYVTSNGVNILERKCKPLVNCRKKCNTRISWEEQNIICRYYWSLGSYDLRASYVSSLIEVQNKKTTKVSDVPLKKNRQFSCKYFLLLNGNKIETCKECFMNTLAETVKFLSTISTKKFNQPELVSTDKRGKHCSTTKLIPPNIVKSIEDHINSFPAYQSHYSRRDTDKKYLHADLNLSQMYKLYTENRAESVSIWTYRRIFKTMNLKFKKPSVDVCNKCDTLNCKIKAAEGSEQVSLLEEQRIHQQLADLAYEEKRNDKLAADLDKSKGIYTFDLQKCLPTPNLNTSISFYKRSLWTFNLTVHDCVSNSVVNHMWHEGIANRGGNEVASCLYTYINALPPSLTSLTFYSDSCPGQNKNSFIASMFLVYMQSTQNIHTVDHKFLEVGHTHLECDSDHAIIEKQKKKTSIVISHPYDWYQFVRTVRSYKPFQVTEMNQTNILNFSKLAKTHFIFRNVDTEGNRFTWQSVKWLRYTNDFGSIKYKNSLSHTEPFKTLNVRRRGVSLVSINIVQPCYNGPIPINSRKKKDLMDLMPLVSPQFHTFYKNLVTDDIADIHPDLVEDDDEDV